MNVGFVFHLVEGFLAVLMSPFFYVGGLLLAFQYFRQTKLERRLFGIRVTDWKLQTWRSIGLGALVGVCASAFMTGIGIFLNPGDLVWVWGLSLLLAIFQVRFICFSYSVGLLSLLSLFLQTLPHSSFEPGLIGWCYQSLLHLDVPHLLALVAILHLAEAVLVYFQGGQQPSPIFLAGKRGRIVGAFILQKYWLLPLVALVSVGSAGDPAIPAFSVSALPGWWPLFPAAVLHGVGVMPLPAVLGFSGVSISSSPKQKAVRTAAMLLIYSVVLLALSFAGAYLPVVLWLAAIVSPLCHEWMIWYEKRLEEQNPPRYTKALQGLRILAVLPGSPAEQMGLKSEEVIVKVNQVPVSTPFDLHFAINQNPAFVKLEILDKNGEVRFVQKPLFEGVHHALGLLLVPDEKAREFVELEAMPVWRMLWHRLRPKSRSSKSYSA